MQKISLYVIAMNYCSSQFENLCPNFGFNYKSVIYTSVMFYGIGSRWYGLDESLGQRAQAVNDKG